MNSERVPFDELPDDVQAFLLAVLGDAVKSCRFTVRDPGKIETEPGFQDFPATFVNGQYQQPTAATHTLHVRADGSACYYGRYFEYWG